MASRDVGSFHEESNFSDEEDGNKKPAAVAATIDDTTSNSTPAADIYPDRGKGVYPEGWRKWEARQHELIWENPDNIGAYQGPDIDFNAIANRHWGNDSCTKLLPIPELDSLVGWATHVTHNGTQEENSSHSNDTTSKTKSLENGLTYNPLIGIQPDAPLPTSHLDTLIHNKARGITPKVMRPPFPGIPNEEIGPYQSTLGQLDTSALVAMGMILEEAITANLLPLAEYHVQRCRALEQLEEEYEQKKEALGEYIPSNHERTSFHQWTLPPEEAIFNIMMSSLSTPQQPVAEPEVPANEWNANSPARINTPFFQVDAGTCRGLLPTACRPNLASFHTTAVSNTSAETGVAKKMDAKASVQRWHEGQQVLRKHPALASHYKKVAAAKSQQESSHSSAAANAPTGTSQTNEQDPLRENAAGKWCKRQELRRKFVNKNIDIFHWFLPAAPSMEAEGQAKIYQKEKPYKKRIRTSSPAEASDSFLEDQAAKKLKVNLPSVDTVTSSTIEVARNDNSEANSSQAGKATTADDGQEDNFFSKLSRDLLPPPPDDDDDDDDDDDNDNSFPVITTSHEV